MPAAPRTDPGVRNYRTGLLPRVFTRESPSPCSLWLDRQTRRCVRSCSAAARLPLAGFLPSILSAAIGAPTALFEDFAGTTHPSDFPKSCIALVPLSGSKRGPARGQASLGISRLPREMLRCVRRVSDHAEYGSPLRYRGIRCCLPRIRTASALRRIGFSRLNTRPALSPVNASTTTLRSSPHDSGANVVRYTFVA